ncbi:hypothetical protein GBA52_021921 [Prunus armeniaca]|nr:hypothetical protein GBA52_021921 [Prunus armeniaca]
MWGSGPIALWLETLDIRADVAKVVLTGAVSKGENTSGVFSDPEQPVGKVRTLLAFSGSSLALSSGRLWLSLIMKLTQDPSLGLFLFGLIKWCDPLSGGNVEGNGWLV